MLPDLQNAAQIFVISSDAFGLPETWVVICLVNGDILSFHSKDDQRAITEWVGLHLPELTSQLERLLAPGMEVCRL